MGRPMFDNLRRYADRKAGEARSYNPDCEENEMPHISPEKARRDSRIMYAACAAVAAFILVLYLVNL